MHHRCLNIVEVQHNIFHHVRNEPDGKATLARLARTSRALSNAALDVLWEQFASVASFIRCLPPDLWRTLEGKPRGKMLSFTRNMTQRDWDIFFRYSYRVRSFLGFESGFKSGLRYSYGLADNVISALSHPPYYAPLFPNLNTLLWNPMDTRYAPLLQWLFARSLVNVTLPHFVFSSPEISLQITSRSPLLKHVRVNAKSLAEVLPNDHLKILSETISRLHSLKSLKCHLPDKAAIIHLSKLPSLVELSLVDNNSKLQALRPRPTAAFASLESLTLKVDHLPPLTSFLEHMRFSPRSVSFTVANTPALEVIHLFSAALVNACDRERLSKISLSLESDSETDSEIPLSTFQLFLTLSNMEFFEFDTRYRLALDDNALEKLVECWPKLTCLSLSKKSNRWSKSHITHRGLIKLLSCCVALNKVALSVDFTDIDQPHTKVPNSRPGNGTTSHCQTLHFVNSKIKFPATIAAFLSDICPILCSVSAQCSDDVGSEGSESGSESEFWDEKWSEVDSLVPVFLAVRRQCKEWYTGKLKEECN